MKNLIAYMLNFMTIMTIFSFRQGITRDITVENPD